MYSVMKTVTCYGYAVAQKNNDDTRQTWVNHGTVAVAVILI